MSKLEKNYYALIYALDESSLVVLPRYNKEIHKVISDCIHCSLEMVFEGEPLFLSGNNIPTINTKSAEGIKNFIDQYGHHATSLENSRAYFLTLSKLLLD